MKKLILLIVSILLLSGCGKTKAQIPKNKNTVKHNHISMNLLKPISKTKIFIDNSLDIQRNKEIMNIVYTSLKKEQIKELSLEDEVSYDSHKLMRVNLTKIGNQNGAIVSNPCIVMCNKKKIDINQVEKLEHSILLKNFNTPVERVSGFKALSWKLFNSKDTPYNIIGKYGIQIPLKLGGKYLYDAKYLEVTDGYLQKYSLKNSLEKVLKQKGFIIVNNKKDADFIFAVENIGFGAIKKISKNLKTPTNLNGYKNNIGLGLSSVAIDANTYSNGTALGDKAALSIAAVGLILSMLDNSGDFINTINLLNIIDNKSHKVLKTVLLSTNRKDQQYIGITDDSIDKINILVSDNFILNSTFKIKSNLEVVSN